MTAATRIPHPKPMAGQVLTKQIKELGNFEYDPDKGGGIPKDVFGLTGAQIKLTGFMIPMDSADRITQFALVPSLFACCFGQPPQIQHTIVVNCPPGKAVAYYADQISVEGTLKVDEQKEDGFIVSIFQLKADSIRPAVRMSVSCQLIASQCIALHWQLTTNNWQLILMTATPLETPTPTLFQRINFRVIIFAAVVLAIVGFPVYIYVDSVLSGGIHQHGNYYEADLKAMSDFPFDQESGSLTDVPQKWRALDGKRVVVVGQIWAPGSASPALANFQLCYSIAKCCFNGPPQIQHFVQARAAHGYVFYADGLVKVSGILHVQVKHDGGKVTQVYSMDVDKAEPM